jgi:hypothetical protein
MKTALCLHVFLAIFLTMFTFVSFADYSIGVSPGTIDMGNISSGSTKSVDFYLTTPSENSIFLRLDSERGNLNFFSKPQYSGLIYNHSEEDTTPWVKVINNPVEIRPDNETLRTSGGLFRGKEKISFLIDVPKDAEPGYHIVYIKPVPSTPSDNIGTVGSRVVAVTSLGVIFNVPGNAIRRGAILDTEMGSYSESRLEIKTYFQNTGTMTISANAIQRIYNGSELIQEMYAGEQFVKPKEIKVFTTYLDASKVAIGDYNAYTIVDYTTGQAERGSIVKVISPSTAAAFVAGPEGSSLLPLLIIAIIVIFSIIIYRRIR